MAEYARAGVSLCSLFGDIVLSDIVVAQGSRTVYEPSRGLAVSRLASSGLHSNGRLSAERKMFKLQPAVKARYVMSNAQQSKRCLSCEITESELRLPVQCNVPIRYHLHHESSWRT